VAAKDRAEQPPPIAGTQRQMQALRYTPAVSIALCDQEDRQVAING
jgi:hypothetical protein